MIVFKVHLLNHIFRLEAVLAPNSKKIPLTERVIDREPLRMPNQPTFSQQASYANSKQIIFEIDKNYIYANTHFPLKYTFLKIFENFSGKLYIC